MRDLLRTHGLGCLLALTAVAVAGLVRYALVDELGEVAPSIPFVLPVMLAGWYGGWWPGITATIAGALLCAFLFVPPHFSLRIESSAEATALTLFVVAGTTISLLSERLHEARRRLERKQRDIQDHLRERARAEEQADRLAAIIEGTPDFVVIRGTDGQTRYMNRAGRRLLGISEDADVSSLRHSTQGPAWADEETQRKWLSAALREGTAAGEGSLLTIDGREVPVSFVLVVHRGAGGQPDLISTVARDISDRKRDEASLHRLNTELREADRRKDEFLATLAHELRNPLAPIRNAVQIIKSKGPAEPGLVWAREVIDRQVGHMARLLDDLLDVSRITRGMLELRRTRAALAAVVENALETSRPLLDAAGLTLAVSLPPESVFVHGDAVRLAQVFSNLLNNAAKYTDRGGAVSLSARREGGDVLVAVRDTGIGLAPEMLPRLFEMFTQAELARERSQGGLGIGLALVKGLVELHGGTVEARSAGPGRGSEFVVRLPLVVSPRSGAVGVAPATTLQDAAYRILVADDLRDNADTLAQVLRSQGHEVYTAYNGEEALSEAEARRPDVILLDLGMPRLSGFEACRRLRRLPWARDVVMIAVTGWGQDDDRRRSQEAGFDHHLVKPVDPAELGKYLGKPAGRRVWERETSVR